MVTELIDTAWITELEDLKEESLIVISTPDPSIIIKGIEQDIILTPSIFKVIFLSLDSLVYLNIEVISLFLQ